MSTSMVKGNPLKLMVQFALPLLLGNLLQQTYNIIDAAIVGQILGAKALASVGATSSVQFLVLGFCIGICAGFGVPVAKYFGAEKKDTMRNYIFNGAVLTAGAAVVLTSACVILCNQILHILSVPEDIYVNAYRYILIIFLGIPFSLLYNYLSSILRSVGDSRTPFIFLAFAAVLNIFLDLFCIVVLKWGCAGAAIATITAQAISGICCLIVISRKMELMWLGKNDRHMRKEAAQELLLMGIPTGLQYSITAIGSMVMQSANNGLGSVYVSAFTAAMRIKQFAMCPFDAVSTAASVFCSQNLGAKQYDRAKKGARFGVLCSITIAELIGIIIYVAAPVLITAFNRDPDVVHYGVMQSRTIALFYCLLAFSHCIAAILRGSGNASVPMIVMLCDWCLFRVSYITVAVRILPDIRVIFWAYPLTWGISSVIFLYLFLRGKWVYGFEKS